jgi:hypothetical protein
LASLAYQAGVPVGIGLAKKRQPAKPAPAVPLRIEAIEPLVVWLRKASPYRVLKLVPYTLAAAFLLVGLIAWLHSGVEPKPANVSELLKYSEGGLAAAIVAALVLRQWGRSFAERWDPAGFKAYALSIQAGVVLLLIPAWLAVDHSRAADMRWNYWGFVDKRWLVSLYGIGVATFLVFPHLMAAILTGIRAAEIPQTPAQPRRWARVAVKLVLGVVMGWFYFGPPWHVEDHRGPVDYHEQVHLGPLQAIDKGYLPYIGPASTQYGPGSQLFLYEYMKSNGKFTVPGFRGANASIHFLAGLIFSILVFQLLNVWEAPWVILLATICSPLGLLNFTNSSGNLDGFYGWTNGLRYLGILFIATTLPPILRMSKDRASDCAAIAAGLVLGWFSWMSQENLAGGVEAVVVVLLLLWLTGTARPGAVIRVLGCVGAGCATFWAPILIYYAYRGALGQFVANYFLYPGVVPSGYTNSYWSSGSSDPMYPAFLFTAVVVIALAVVTLCDVRSLRLRTHLAPRQCTMLAAIVVLGISFQSALFRSDASHLVNTLIALPVVLCIGWFDLPHWLTGSVRWQWGIRIVYTVLVLLVYPVGNRFAHPYRWLVQPELARFHATRQLEAAPNEGRAAFRRATPYLSGKAEVDVRLRTRPFLEDMSEIHELIGSRKMLVLGYPKVGPEFVYFMADVIPAPVLVDSLMVVNERWEDREMAYFRKKAGECGALIAMSAGQTECRIFLDAHSNAKVMNRVVDGFSYVLMIADPDRLAGESACPTCSQK